jgi:hypothetical protein
MQSLRAATLAAAMSFALAAHAQQPAAVPPDMVDAAKSIQTGCVKRGEYARVCACGVGLAYAQLDPKVFKLVPKVEPLLDQKDKTAATTGLVTLAASSGLGISDLMGAYDTIRANRQVVRQVCRPLAPGAKPR